MTHTKSALIAGAHMAVVAAVFSTGAIVAEAHGLAWGAAAMLSAIFVVSLLIAVAHDLMEGEE